VADLQDSHGEDALSLRTRSVVREVLAKGKHAPMGDARRKPDCPEPSRGSEKPNVRALNSPFDAGRDIPLSEATEAWLKGVKERSRIDRASRERLRELALHVKE
jgi:hypothetical protein